MAQIPTYSTAGSLQSGAWFIIDQGSVTLKVSPDQIKAYMNIPNFSVLASSQSGNNTDAISAGWAYTHENLLEEHIDWTVDQGTLQIHPNNYTASGYTHPSYSPVTISLDSGPLTGATVIDDITVSFASNTLGHATSGSGTVSTRNLTLTNLNATLDEITDVTFNSLLDGQVLTYDGTNGWVNQSPVTGVTDHLLLDNIGYYNHDDLDIHYEDTTIHFTKASIDHQQLQNISTKYLHSDIDNHIDNAGLHFTKSSINLGDLGNVNLSGLSDGHVLTYDTTNGWQNEPAGAGIAVLEDITDVSFDSTLASGQILTYDGTNGWINADAPTTYTHPNHTGEVTSVGDGTQTISTAFITNKTNISVGQFQSTDEFVFYDTDAAGYKATTFTVLNQSLDHDVLTNFSSNEHIDWTGAAQNFLTTGYATADFFVATDSTYSLRRDVSNSVLNIVGGPTAGDPIIRLHGSTKSTEPYDILFLANSTEVLRWDESANAWDFATTNITDVGSITADDINLTNQGGSAIVKVTSANANLHLLAAPAISGGAGIQLFGNASANPSHIYFRDDNVNKLFYDGTDWEFTTPVVINSYGLTATSGTFTNITVGATNTISMGVDNASLDIDGGSGASAASVILYGGVHGSKPGDLEFKSGSTVVLSYDADATTGAGLWDFGNEDVALGNLSVDDLDVTYTLQVGTSISSLDSLGSLDIYGGALADTSGGYIKLYGSSAGASYPVEFYYNGVARLKYVASGGIWDFDSGGSQIQAGNITAGRLIFDESWAEIYRDSTTDDLQIKGGSASADARLELYGYQHATNPEAIKFACNNLTRLEYTKDASNGFWDFKGTNVILSSGGAIRGDAAGNNSITLSGGPSGASIGASLVLKGLNAVGSNTIIFSQSGTSILEWVESGSQNWDFKGTDIVNIDSLTANTVAVSSNIIGPADFGIWSNAVSSLGLVFDYATNSTITFYDSTLPVLQYIAETNTWDFQDADIDLGTGSVFATYLECLALYAPFLKPRDEDYGIILHGAIDGSGLGGATLYLFAEKGGYSGNYLLTGQVLSDINILDCSILGVDAYASATTNITGGGLIIAGGVGAVNSSGAAHGGDVTLSGGSGYGTGNGGSIIIDGGEAFGTSGIKGTVTIGNFTFNTEQIPGTGEDGYVLTYDNSTNSISLEAATTGALTLEELTDVAFDTSLTDGHVLTYDGTNGWINAAPSTGSTTLAALTDTDITTPADGAYLIYDTGTATWRDFTLSGDVTGNDSGAVTIANNAVTLAKMADVATGTVFYRKTAATGDPEVQTLATLKTDLGLTGTNSGDQTITLTSDVTGSGTGSFATTIANNVVSNTKLRDSTALSVIGRSANSTGDPADISAGTDGHVLRRSGTTLGFGTVATAGIANNAVTLAKMADVATGTVFYRKTAATGDPEVQTLATLKTDLGLTGTNSGDQTSIVGITGTMAQFDTAVSDGNIAYAGGAFHNGFSDYVANEHINWTAASDNFVTSGYNQAAYYTISGATGGVSSTGTTGYIYLAGGNGAASGANIWLYSSGFSGKAADITFRAGATTTLEYDYSATTWDFQANDITTTGTLTASNFSGTNTGDQTSIVGITGTKSQFDTAVTDGNFLYVGDVTSNATHTGEVTGSTALTIQSSAITNRTAIDAVALNDSILAYDLTAAALREVTFGQMDTYFTSSLPFASSSHNHDSDYISIVSTPTTGNFPQLTAGGELVNSAYDETSFDAAGTASSAVSTHESTYNHGSYDSHIALTNEHINWTAASTAFSTTGTLTSSTHIISNATSVRRDATNSLLGLYGGSAIASGSGIKLYGSTNPSKPSWIELLDDNVIKLMWNGTNWDFQATNVSNIGTLSATNLSGTNTGDEVSATDTVEGIVELATQAEVNAGTDTTRVVTPNTLANYTGLGGGSLDGLSDVTIDTTLADGHVLAYAGTNGWVNQLVDTVGTITSGTWNGTALTANYVPNHDSLNGVSANQHIDWTSTSSNLVTSGDIQGSIFKVSGSTIQGTTTSGLITFAGGATGGWGSSLTVYGGAHASAGDFLFDNGSGTVLLYDNSATSKHWNFQWKDIATGGTVWTSNLTFPSTPGGIYSEVDDSYITFFGGQSLSDGGGVWFYGPSETSNGGDIVFASGVSSILDYDHSVTAWSFTNSKVSIGTQQTTYQFSVYGSGNQYNSVWSSASNGNAAFLSRAHGTGQAQLVLTGGGLTAYATSFELIQTSGGVGYIQNRSNADIIINTNSTEIARFNSDGGLSFKERSATPTTAATYGTLWVKNNDPSELWFTDDGGNSYKVALVGVDLT